MAQRKEEYRLQQQREDEERRLAKQVKIDAMLQGYLLRKPKDFYGYKCVELAGFNYYIVAELDKPFLGSVNGDFEFLGDHVMNGPGWVNISGTVEKFYIEDIQVRDENKGFGSLLLAYLEEVARAEGCLKITGNLVWPDYPKKDKLCHFYEKNGYEVVLKEANNRWGYIYKDL